LETATALLFWACYFYQGCPLKVSCYSNCIDLTSNNTTLCVTNDKMFIGIFMGYYTSRIFACSWKNNTKMDLQEVGWEARLD
jgi:hypothetical protein